MLERLAYLEKQPDGRWQVVFAGSLFPGYSTHFSRTWAHKRDARKAAIRNGFHIARGDCPLMPVPPQIVASYHAQHEARLRHAL